VRHTPGPWEVRRSDVYQVGGRHIAYTGPHHTPESDYPQGCKLVDDANARLIAAAPELLQALEKANTFIAGFSSETRTSRLERLKREIKSTIAKAKGDEDE